MKLKKYTVLCTFFCMIALLCGCQKAVNPGFYLYKSSPLGFQIEYPNTWAKQVDTTSKVAAFLTPTEGFGDEYRDNVTISVTDCKDGQFDAFYKSYYTTLPATFPGFQETEAADVLVGNKPARKIIFTSSTTQKDENGNKKTIALKIAQYVVDNGTKVHFITYIAAPNAFDYFEPFFNTMLETVKFS